MSSQRSGWRERLRANPSRMEQELAIKLQEDRVNYLTQVEIRVAIADFYFPLDPRPLLVFCRRLGSSWNSSDVQGRRTPHSATQERVQNTGIILRQLLGHEKRSALRRDPEQPRNAIAESVLAIDLESGIWCVGVRL